ncbi:MAG: restriction endonuclease [Cyanosarcina radialis HA8281-LM2]|jgi:hypothetical protein|nr:restriction endonuclease [Cyanosarcina radialis HA8281-LM2]
MSWKEYEERVYKYFQYKYPDAILKKNTKLRGRLSDALREIDLLIEVEILGHSLQIAIECKDWNSKLDVADIDSFVGKLKDVGISKGVIISRLGYTEAAYRRARKEIELQLQVLDFDNLPSHYGFWGVPYRGDVGAVILAPNGWVINNEMPDSFWLHQLCWLHPYEFLPEEAGRKKHLCYFNVLPIVGNENLQSLFNSQDLRVKEKDPRSKIDYQEEPSPNGTVIYRRIDYIKDGYVEFTGGIEADDFFAYCVCAVPQDWIPDDLARLRYIMNNLRLIKLMGVDPSDSHKHWKALLE